MPSIVVILHNIRSAHNVGAILRSAEGFGVTACYLTGYTPFPLVSDDPRLPHIAIKIDKAIAKTALGAEKLVPVHIVEDIATCISELRHDGYTIIGLEQHRTSIDLDTYVAPAKCAVLLGEEVAGIPAEVLPECDALIEIPMHGRKESFNVSVAAGIALYELSRKH